MKPERWKQIEKLYDAAMELDVSRRAAFLDQACASDEGLRREVASLLVSDEQAGSFLATPAVEVAARSIAAAPISSPIGRRIGHYQVESLLGAGGMGEVYLAQDTQLGRRLALKLLPTQLTADADRLRRFKREARTASALNHPNIITIFEIGQEGSTHYIATEFIDGETLRQQMESGRAGLSRALDVAAQIAAALVAAHEAGITHRDIKPENVMVRRDGYVKVLDFGLAKLTEPLSPVIDSQALTPARNSTEPWLVMGTPRYMSPEQARGEKMDARTDIFSLGAVLYEMVAARTPFEGVNVVDVLGAILNREPIPLKQHAPDAPDELQRIIGKVLRKDREERYQTAKDLLLDLEALKQDLEIEARLRCTIQASSNGGVMAGGSDVPATIRTAQNSATPTVEEATARTTSRAEYLVSGIKQHKRRFAFALAVLLLAALGFGYWFLAHRSANTTQIESIAVMPFQNASGNADVEYLSDGITESLINSLSRLPNLSVKARSTVFRYKGREVDSQKVASELSVQAILSGRVVQRGDDLALYLSLVDSRNGNQIWGEQYTRKLSDIFALQAEIATDIAEELHAKLTGEEKKLLAKRYTNDTEAYQLYLKGRYFWDKRTEDGFKRAIDYFRQATQRDPQYALAHTGLADSYIGLTFYNFLPPKEAMPQAKASALEAQKYDDMLAEAHVSLAHVQVNYDWNWEGAESEFKRGIELNPRYPTAHQWYAIHYLTPMGRLGEALTQMSQAMDLDPLSLVMNTFMGSTLYFAGRYDQAIGQCVKTLELNPDFGVARWHLGLALVQEARFEEAIAELNKAVTLSGGSPLMKAALGHAYAASGRRGEAMNILTELQKLAERSYVSASEIAAIYAGLGERDRAMAWLEKAAEERAFHLVYLKVRPEFAPLRSDPRFKDLLRRIGLAP